MASEAPRTAPAQAGPVVAAVCNYNGEQHLPPCLDALFAQTRPPDEVVVYDNASTDGSEEVVRTRYPRARWVAMGSNRGPCAPRNRALEEATGRWVLLVDNDAVLAPDVLERLLAAAAEHEGAVLLQPRSVFADEPSLVHYDGARFHYVGLYTLRNQGLPLAQAEGRGVVPVDGAISVALLAERAALLELGGFDERYFFLAEDLELSWRVRLRGWGVWSVEEALVLHRGGTAGLSFRSGSAYPRRRAFLHSRNRWLFLVEGLRWRTLVVALPGLALYEAVTALFNLRMGTFGSYLAGKLSFLRALPSALAKRRRVQRTRRLRDRDLLVGGPLTVSPQLSGKGRPPLVLRLLDRALRAWWVLARHLAG